VRVELASVFEHRPVIKQLRTMGRPVVGSGNRYLDVPARDDADAAGLIDAVSTLQGVDYGRIIPLGRVRRWLFRQRFAGNYGSSSGVWFGGTGGDGGGGGNGGGGNGGG